MIGDERPSAERIEVLDVTITRELAAAHRRLYPEAGSELLEVGGGTAAFMGTLPTTRVLGFGMGGPVTDQDFERLEAFYQERHAPVVIELCPYADPSAVAGLARRGYRPAGWKQLLIRPIGARDRDDGGPPGVRVSRALAGDLETWARLVGQGFLEGPEVDHGSRELYATIGETASNTCWIATVEGVPAGGACVAIQGDMASFASTSTLREFRRRGVHGALIGARLAHAASAGCRWARVAASPGSDSQRNLERHGFQVVYTRMKFTLDRGGAAAP